MMLGNLSVKQMEEQTGIIFPDKLKDVLNKCHQSKANDIKEGYWHCFNYPFTMICGGKDLFDFVVKHLTPLSDSVTKQPLYVTYTNIKKGYIKS